MARSIDIKRGRTPRIPEPTESDKPEDVKPNEFYDNPDSQPSSPVIRMVNIFLTVILIGLVGAVIYLIVEPSGQTPLPTEGVSGVRDQLTAEPAGTAEEASPPPPQPSTQPTTPERLTVKVLNGSGKVGVAGAAATTLRAAAYNVTAVGNAKRFNYDNTTIFYSAERRVEAEAAAKTLGKAEASLEEEPTVTAGVDLVVVIGAR